MRASMGHLFGHLWSDRRPVHEKGDVHRRSVRAKIPLDVEPQTVTVACNETTLTISCTCPKSRTKLRCVHKLAVLRNQTKVLVEPGDLPTLEEIQTWVRSTAFAALWERYCKTVSAGNEPTFVKNAIEAQLVDGFRKGFRRHE